MYLKNFVWPLCCSSELHMRHDNDTVLFSKYIEFYVNLLKLLFNLTDYWRFVYL